MVSTFLFYYLYRLYLYLLKVKYFYFLLLLTLHIIFTNAYHCKYIYKYYIMWPLNKISSIIPLYSILLLMDSILFPSLHHLSCSFSFDGLTMASTPTLFWHRVTLTYGERNKVVLKILLVYLFYICNILVCQVGCINPWEMVWSTLW